MRKPYNGNLPITSEFGNRSFWSGSQQITDFHNGIDIGGEFDVISVASGVVSSLSKGGRVDANPTINTPASYVTIDHGAGVKTIYWHLGRVDVNMGDRILEGQVVGRSGNTGYAFGKHLHFMVVVNGSNVNPRNYINFSSDVNTNNNMGTEERTYIIEQGDYLEGIAIKLYGDINRVYDLQNWNGIQDRDKIEAGATLIYYVDKVVENNTDMKDAKEQISKLQKQLEDLTASTNKDMDKIKADAQLKLDSIIQEKTEYIAINEDKISKLTADNLKLSKEIESFHNAKIDFGGTINVENIFIDAFDLTKKKGIIWKAYLWYKEKVSRLNPDNLILQNIANWDIFVIAGSILASIPIVETLTSTFPEMLKYKGFVYLVQFISMICGVIVKIIKAFFDKNHDGVLDINDTKELYKYTKKA